MNILYHLTAPPPKLAGTDAVFQEVEILRKKFGGEIINLYPLSHPTRWFPRSLYGFKKLGALRAYDQSVDIHHVYHANYYPFPALKHLEKPIVYSVVAGLHGQARPTRSALRRAQWIVVSNERDRAVLKHWKYENYTMIRPGIDVSRFTQTPLDKKRPFVLLVGSAPWVRAQFRQKGIDIILQAAKQIKDLQVVFLWRGLLLDELEKRIRKFGIEARVEIVNEQVDVNTVLARCHATVVLADTPKIVKAYPHSLLESLAAGKPVIASEAIPIADYIREKECGTVAESLHSNQFLRALQQMIDDYDRFLSNARHIGARDFSTENLLRSYKDLYQRIGSG